jgi:predicted nucleic-acid-binding Zn-ribbon protein
MTQPKTCRSCGSSELFTASVSAGGGSSTSLLPVGAMHGARFENIVCADCGLTEWYVAAEHRHLVKDKLQPLAPRQGER